MEEPKFRKYYLDWWKIRRSTIAWLVALLVVLPLVAGLSYWAIKNEWFAQTAVADMPKDAARIISFEGDVRITRAATRETIVVTKETYVAAGDTIQTQSDGKATVQMLDGSVYTVRANSTVVVRDNSSIFGGTNIRVSLDDGQLNVRTDQQPENTKNVVEMMDSETQVKSQTDASFNADAGTNGGEIRISRGSVETTIGGQQATLNANEYAAVNNGRLSGKEQLLAPPRPLTPENSAQVIDAAGQGIAGTFTWQDDSTGPVAGYYLQIARSPYFAADSIMVDRGSITTRDFRLAGMMPGVYYWRLKTTSRSGQTSEWSEPWRFSIVRRGPAGEIDVADWRTENVGGSVYIVSGRTSPGLRVRALGREIFSAGDGSFRLQVATPLSEVAVELSDDRGNRAGFVVALRGGKLLRRF
jgi:hypothetical protein